ncbi:MAG: glycerophosphodiester phosphodiesterase family protein [Gemmatimonadaceae bacterium]
MDILLDPNAHPVIAHRGASGYAPENTLVAFQLAVDQGADALEFDVHVSLDGIPVVIHDPALGRTTDRSGAVASLPYSAIRAADAGARWTSDNGRSFPWRGRRVFVPTLDDVVSSFPDIPLVIEIKTRHAQEVVQRVLAKHGAVRRCIVAASEVATLDQFDVAAWSLGAAQREIRDLKFPLLYGRRADSARYSGIFVPEWYWGLPIATRRFVRAARAMDCPVHVWTVNSVSAARRLWGRGVAGIVTDYAPVMLAARESVFG